MKGYHFFGPPVIMCIVGSLINMAFSLFCQWNQVTWKSKNMQSMTGRTRDALLSFALWLCVRRCSVTSILPAKSGNSAAAVRTGTTLVDCNRKWSSLSSGVDMRTRPAPPMIGVCAVQPKYRRRCPDVVAIATPVMTWRNWAVLAGAASHIT